MVSCILAIAAMGLLQAAPALAEGDEAKADDGGITKLINQLDSEVFADREAATDRLTKLGPPAIEALMAAALQDSPETRFRALRVLTSLYSSDDPATKEAAKRALEMLNKSDNLSIRRSAEKILATPQYEIPSGIWRAEGNANVFGGERAIILQGAGGISITGAGIRIGADGQLILARVNGGERRIDTITGSGVGVLLLEGRNEIEIHVRQPQKKGDPQFTRYLAKDSKDLADNYPKIHKLYKTLAVYNNNQTIISNVTVDP